MAPLLDPKFENLRLYTIGKQYIPRQMLHKHCVELHATNQVLSAATGGRFTAEFFRSLGDFDRELPGRRVCG